MKRLLGCAALASLIVGSMAGSARAQTEAPPPAAASSSSSSSGRGGGGSGGQIGVGGIAYLSGPAGLSVAFDPGVWHLDTMLLVSGGDNQNSLFEIGGRFWYHLKSTGSADLSVGAGLAYRHTNPPGPAVATSDILIEGGLLVRLFLVSNVALGASSGFVVGTNDVSFYSIGATSLVGAMSFHYFF
jgi:hypothetical protein